VAARTCPYCLTKIPATTIIAHSYDLVCPGCQRPLEISRISRNLAAFAGLVAGTGMAYAAFLESPHHQALGWVLPLIYAIVFYGVTAAIVLLLWADLSLKAEPHEAQSHPPSAGSPGGHAAGHH